MMKHLVAIVALSACSVPRPTTVLDDRSVLERSHDVLLAYDRGDVARLSDTLATSFVHIDSGDTTTRAEDLQISPGAVFPRIGKRTWADERIFASQDVRIFHGLADEEQTGNEVHGNYHFRGWYTQRLVPRIARLARDRCGLLDGRSARSSRSCHCQQARFRSGVRGPRAL